MNLFDRLYDEAKKKKRELEQVISGQPVTRQVISPEAQNKIKNAKYGVLANNRGAQDKLIAGGNVEKFSVRKALPGVLKTTVPQTMRATDLAARRTGIDVLQAGSGLYDLASKGTGTNRFSKRLDQTAKNIDADAGRQGSTAAYRIMQAPLNIATFATPGGIAKGAAKLPNVAKQLDRAGDFATKQLPTATRAAEKIIARKADTVKALADKGTKGRIASQALKQGATPAMALNAATGTGYDLGLQSGKGEDISKLDVGITAAANVALPFALPAAGQAGLEVFKGSKVAGKAVNQAQKASQNKVRTNSGIEKDIRSLDKEEAAVLKQIQRTPVENTVANNNLAARLDRIRYNKAEKAKQLQKVTVKDKVLTMQPGMTVGGPDALARMSAVKRARMEREGMVFDGVDGKKRFEIDDSGSRLISRDGQTVGDVLDHPQLYEQYPQLRNTPVSWEGLPSNVGGSYNDATGVLRLNKNLPDEIVRKKVLHELTHNVQDVENFAKGANVSESTQAVAAIKQEVQAIEQSPQFRAWKQERQAVLEDPTLTPDEKMAIHKQMNDNKPEVVQEHERLVKDMLATERRGVDEYWKNAAEAEARAVEARADMPMSQRYKDLKQFTFDTGSRNVGEIRKYPVIAEDVPAATEKAKKWAARNNINFDSIDPNSIPTMLKRSTFYDSLDVPKDELIIRQGDGGTAMSIDKRAYADDLTPDQNQFIAAWAEELKSVGQGNGVSFHPDGRKLSSDFRDLDKSGKSMTNTDWFDKARDDIESGRVPAEIREEFDSLGSDNLPPLDIPEGFEAPEMKKSRFANTTVQNSDEVSDPAKQAVKNKKVQYQTTTNAGRLEQAESALQGNADDDNFTRVMESLTDTAAKTDGQSEATAITLAKQLDAKGDDVSLAKSTELYERLSERFSKSGQEVQAASLLSNRTPEGLQYGAIRDLKKNGIEATPERQKAIKELTDAVRSAGDDLNAANLARYRLAKYVSEQLPQGVGNRLVNLWRAGLLTAPTTTGGNILGNTGEAAVRKLWVNPLASAIDMGFGAFTGKRTMTLAPAGGFTKGAATGAKKLPEFIKTGYDERNALSKYDTRELNYGNTAVGKLVGNYVNGTYRLMSLADQPFWYGARGEALASIANAEAKTKKLKGDAKNVFIREFMDNPPKQAIERATQEAKYATFQNKTALGGAASGLKQGARNITPLAGDVADFFVPFTQVPASIATRIVTRTPVGTATAAVRQFLNVKAGKKFDQRAMSQAIAEGSFGPAVFGAGYALANSGQLTFGFPEDRKERELWEAEGKQPYSVKVGDRWYSLNYLQPFGTLLSIGGEAANAIKDGAGTSETISRGIATAGQSVMNQSFLKGISGVLEAIDDPKRFGERYVSNTAGSVVPNFVRSFARSTDDLQRESGDALTGIKQAIPGLRQTTNSKLDMFGEEVTAKDNFANQFINPLRPSKDKSGDPVAMELRRLLEVDSGVLPTAATKNSLGNDTKLTDTQVRSINKLAGPALKQEYARTIADERYKALSDEDKAKALKEVNSTVFGALKQKYAAENQVGQFSPDYTGKEAKLNTNQKRYLKGQGVDALTSDDDPTYAEKYETALDDFNTSNKEWSNVERAKKRKELKKLEVQKDYGNDTVSLYGMSKADIYSLVSQDPDGNAIVERLIKYGDAMENAGLTTNKLRDSKGNIAIRPKEKGSGGGSGKSRLTLANDFKSPYDILFQTGTAGARLARNATLAKKRG